MKNQAFYEKMYDNKPHQNRQKNEPTKNYEVEMAGFLEDSENDVEEFV